MVYFIDNNGYLFGSRHQVNNFEQINHNKFISVNSSSCHTIAIDETGCLWANGANNLGQLGFGDNKHRNNLEKIPVNKKFIMVSCGNFHTMAIDENGGLWGCGSNEFGQLGLGNCDNEGTNIFVKIPTVDNAKIVSCGSNYTMMIDQNGCLWGCGLNNFGQLGLGTTTDIYQFEKIMPNEIFVMVNCGSFHTMAIDQNGYLWGCGDNDAGQLGIGPSDGGCRDKLEKITMDNTFTMVNCGSYHTTAISIDGTLWICGGDDQLEILYGELEYRNTFEIAVYNKKFLLVGCIGLDTLAVDVDGYLWLNHIKSDTGQDCYLEKLDNISDIQFLVNSAIIRKTGFNTKGSHKHYAPS